MRPHHLSGEVVAEAVKETLFGFLVTLEVVRIPEFFQDILLIARQCLWDVDIDIHEYVAVTISVTLY